jgi:hypothetical protein
MQIEIDASKTRTRPRLEFGDLRNGDIFQYRRKNVEAWNPQVFVMIDRTQESPGQCCEIGDAFDRTWFVPLDKTVEFRKFLTMKLSNPTEFKE